MNSWHLVMFGAAVVGLASGQGSLEWAIAPPHQFAWRNVMFAFTASTLAMASVLALQLLQKDEQYSRRVFRFMMPIAIFITGSGVAALAVAIHLGNHGPAAWLFLAYGAGALLGLCGALPMLRAMSASQRVDNVVRSLLRMLFASGLGYLGSSLSASIVFAGVLWGSPLAGFLLPMLYPAFPLFLFVASKAWFIAWVVAFVVFSIVSWRWLSARRKSNLPNRSVEGVQ